MAARKASDQTPEEGRGKMTTDGEYCASTARNNTLLLMDYGEDKVDEMVLALLSDTA